VRLKDLTYHDWLKHAFGHEVRFQQAAWFFDHDRDWWDPEPAVALAYLTRLFESPEPLIFDSQIAQGLTYLVNTSASGETGGSTRLRCRSRIALAALKRSLHCLRNCSNRAVPLICRI
jgi:hypothetical protein